MLNDKNLKNCFFFLRQSTTNKKLRNVFKNQTPGSIGRKDMGVFPLFDFIFNLFLLKITAEHNSEWWKLMNQDDKVEKLRKNFASTFLFIKTFFFAKMKNSKKVGLWVFSLIVCAKWFNSTVYFSRNVWWKFWKFFWLVRWYVKLFYEVCSVVFSLNFQKLCT